jgi:hypothetical protein
MIIADELFHRKQICRCAPSPHICATADDFIGDVAMASAVQENIRKGPASPYTFRSNIMGPSSVKVVAQVP